MLCLYIIGKQCFHLTFKPYLSSVTYSRIYIWETAKYIYTCMWKYYRNNEFVENVCPANSALFIYVSTHCVETVKKLEYNRCSQLTQWCSGNASAFGARGPGFNSRLRQGFLYLIFFGFFFTFCPKHIICPKILKFFLQC